MGHCLQRVTLEVLNRQRLMLSGWAGQVEESSTPASRQGGRQRWHKGRGALLKAFYPGAAGDTTTTSTVAKQALGRVTQLLAGGAAPKGLYPYFAAGRIVPIAKPNGGVRPIVLQPAIYKLIAMTILNVVAGAVKTVLGPYQHGVQVC